MRDLRDLCWSNTGDSTTQERLVIVTLKSKQFLTFSVKKTKKTKTHTSNNVLSHPRQLSNFYKISC